MKHFNLTLLLLLLIASSSFAIKPITSDSVFCISSVATFSDSTSGGKWYSGTTAVATIDSTKGLFTGISAGTVTITYAVGASYITKTVTVQPNPVPIIGTTNVCVGSTTILSDTIVGGKWGSNNNSIATIDSITGVVSGVKEGTSIITYTQTGKCYDTIIIMVHKLGGTIYYGGELCLDEMSEFYESESGGIWSSANTAIAILGSTLYGEGINVKGMAIGNDTINYTVTNICGIGTATYPFEVHEAGSCWGGIVVTGLQPDGLKVYPNPVTTSLTISSADMITSVTITNLIGQTVYCNYYHNEEVQVDVADLPRGVYFIKINGTEIRKFVKQ